MVSAVSQTTPGLSRVALLSSCDVCGDSDDARAAKRWMDGHDPRETRDLAFVQMRETKVAAGGMRVVPRQTVAAGAGSGEEFASRRELPRLRIFRVLRRGSAAGGKGEGNNPKHQHGHRSLGAHRL